MIGDRQYRDAAAAVIARLNGTEVRSDGHLEAELRPEIQRAGGGAFVQCWVWVPDEAIVGPQHDATGEP